MIEQVGLWSHLIFEPSRICDLLKVTEHECTMAIYC